MMISPTYSHRLASVHSSVEVAQLGGACESQNPAKGAHPSQPSPGVIPYLFLCPRPMLRITKPPGAAWRAKNERENMAWINRNPRCYRLPAQSLPPPRPGATSVQILFKWRQLHTACSFSFPLPPKGTDIKFHSKQDFRTTALSCRCYFPEPSPQHTVLEGKRSCFLITLLFSISLPRQVWMLSHLVHRDERAL